MLRPHNCAIRVLTIIAAVLSGAGCAQEVPQAKFNRDDCRRVAIKDAVTGDALRGAEDIAFDREGDRLIVSAYDRRAAERAIRDRAASLPEGGVYDVPLSALFSTDRDEITSEHILKQSTLSHGLRPHGIDYNAESGELVIINRGYRSRGRRWHLTTSLVRLSASGDMTVSEIHCAANDVAAMTGEVYFSQDHAGCGGGAILEDVLGLRRSSVRKVGGDALIAGLGFANGVAARGEGIVVAATREKALYHIPSKDLGKLEKFKLSGAPDNLSIAENGDAIIAALHPSLIRLALNRKLGHGKAPSKIISLDVASGEETVLFYDKDGAVFSAATVAVLTDDGLVAGSVTDKGLLVCQDTT